jgi:hypothetical protein
MILLKAISSDLMTIGILGENNILKIKEENALNLKMLYEISTLSRERIGKRSFLQIS